jgi:hypothetical protein
MSEFQEFVGGIENSGCTFMRLGKGLLLIGISMPRRPLYDRLHGGTTISRKDATTMRSTWVAGSSAKMAEFLTDRE